MIAKAFSTDFRLDQKVAVITGAASGIGLETAKLFSKKGARVCMVDLNLDKVLKAALTIDNASAYAANIADVQSVDAAVRAIMKNEGRIDVLVNSAGVGDIEWAEQMRPEIWERVIAINLTGTFFMSQRVGREMIAAQNGGKILSLASQAGSVAIDKHVAYSASKAGVISMTQSLAYEWGKHGIQVNAISPTATETPLIMGYWDVGEVHEKAIANTPAGRFCKPEEVACCAVFLASEAANMITGANIVIDGGYTIH
ncbi:GolD/DthD family dehydrogenase [Bacillota bacterium Meth-B3]|nr:D-threitol dehydrogenase [Christensenellaceae bacterium]MEA5064834.1 D-threitol dehydrogenase [Eubacteriales bacterium]